MIEACAVIIVIASVVAGAKKGLVRMIYGMIRFILAFILATVLAPFIAKLMPSNVLVPQGIAFVLAFVLTTIILSVVYHFLGLVNHIPVLNQVNRVAGAVAGFFAGLIVVWLALMVVGVCADMEWCRFVAKNVKKSEVLMWFHNLNPILHLWKQVGLPKLYK